MFVNEKTKGGNWESIKIDQKKLINVNGTTKTR